VQPAGLLGDHLVPRPPDVARAYLEDGVPTVALAHEPPDLLALPGGLVSPAPPRAGTHQPADGAARQGHHLRLVGPAAVPVGAPAAGPAAAACAAAKVDQGRRHYWQTRRAGRGPGPDPSRAVPGRVGGQRSAVSGQRSAVSEFYSDRSRLHTRACLAATADLRRHTSGVSKTLSSPHRPAAVLRGPMSSWAALKQPDIAESTRTATASTPAGRPTVTLAWTWRHRSLRRLHAEGENAASTDMRMVTVQRWAPTSLRVG